MRLGLLCSALLVASVARGERRALVLGENEGAGADAPLSFAETDAELTGRTLLEVGAVDAAHLVVLKAESLEAVRARLRAFAQESAADDEVLVFFSGHGGADGLHVRGDVWPWSDVRKELARLPARLVIAFFDACFSGALFTAKGLTREAPLSLSLLEGGGRGRFWVSSSGANELSYESLRIQGSPFSAALRTGLRGAADADRDGQVTLPELYDFVYRRTVASTLSSPTGPQHPVQSSELQSAGEVVLVRSKAGPQAKVSGWSRGGRCYLLDAKELEVLAELASRTEQVQLPPGEYAVRCVWDDQLWSARVRLEGDTSLDTLTFQKGPAPAQLAKGAGAAVTQRFSISVGWSTTSGAGLWLAYRGGTRDFGWTVGLSGQLGGELALTVGGSTRLSWWNVVGTELHIGVAAALSALRPLQDWRAGGGGFAELDGPQWPGQLRLHGRVELLALEPFSGGNLQARFAVALGVAWGS
jgi:hypothetical protein